MLLKLSDRISECLDRAADARDRANAATDPSIKSDFLSMELHWLRLVESYRFVEQADQFLADGRVTRIALNEKLPKTGVLVVTCPATGKDFSTGILTDEVSFARLSQELIHSDCPHCHVDHSWRTKDATLVADVPPGARVERARAEGVEPGGRAAAFRASLHALVRTAIENTKGEARAAFYISDGAALHHVVGMPEAYARYVDGFAIGPQSLACGLAAARGEPIITRDVTEEPLWKPWLWLAQQFDYRACWSFPVETPARKIVGTFAMYYRDPREATPRDLDLAATITRTAAIMISPQTVQ